MAKGSVTRNWPMLIAVALALIFIVGVWVNSYRTTHAAAPVVSIK
jgi:hypothetical protein